MDNGTASVAIWLTLCQFWTQDTQQHLGSDVLLSSISLEWYVMIAVSFEAVDLKLIAVSITDNKSQEKNF